MKPSPIKQFSKEEFAKIAKQTAEQSAEQALFEVHEKIYPRTAHGWFSKWRWLLVWFTQLVFYGSAWLNWNGRQAILFDLTARKFYIFGLVIVPQDFIYLTILLVISALSLFLFTTIAGRLFCGYACPQTVYTEIFMWVERKVEGDRTARMRLDKGGVSPRKFGLKMAKHAIWIGIALWTGFTFVGYFTPIHHLAQEMLAWTLGPWETFWVFFYAFATYGNAGWMREQVCKYMCPYARFQSAMFDKDTLTVTYDAARGDPRGSRSKNADYQKLGLGACVDCGICVQVCPTGIDIRDGLQYECTGCTACIDGCNDIMGKMGYEPGLIRYTTEHAIENGLDSRAMWQRVFRPRVLFYSGILLTIILATSVSLFMRVPMKVNVIRDRGMPRVTETGSVDNVYKLQIMNAVENSIDCDIEVEGIPGATITSNTKVMVPGATDKSVAVRVEVPQGSAVAGSNKIHFIVRDSHDHGVFVSEKAVFIVPH